MALNSGRQHLAWRFAAALAAAASAPATDGAEEAPSVRIYVEDFAVRQEVFLPLAEHRQLGVLPPAERAVRKQQSAAAVAQRFRLRIDGRPATPDRVRSEWLRFGVEGALPLGEAESPDATTVLGVAAVYPVDGNVRRVEFDLEDHDWTQLPVTLEGGREIFSSYLSVADPHFLWERDDILSMAGQGDNDARTLLRKLLRNVYGAYALAGEDAVYDRLASSLGGDLLESVYLSQRQSLLMQARGGGECRVSRVEVLEAGPEAPSDGGHWRMQARWVADGAVAHWGHTHARRRQYSAVLGLDRQGSGWRITALDLSEETAVGLSGS